MKLIYTILPAFIFAVSAAAQSRSMGGTVTDEAKAVVPGANVPARRGAEVFTTTSDAEGKFEFANLPNRAWRLPSYARADVNFAYRRENWRFDVAVKNLNNVRYFETGGFNTMMPQPTRHALAAVTYNF